MHPLLILLLVILFSMVTTYKEPFRLYMSNSHYLPLNSQITRTKNVRPRQSVPPGVTNINKKFKNNGMIFSKSDYCDDNPTCYPCPNWKHVGPPVCL